MRFLAGMAFATALCAGWILGLMLGQWGCGHGWQLELGLLSAALASGVALATWAGARHEHPWCWLLGLAALVAGVARGAEPREAGSYAEPGLYRLKVRVLEVRHGRDHEAHSLVQVLAGHRLSDGLRVPPGGRIGLAPRALPEASTVVLLAKLRPAARFRNLTPQRRFGTRNHLHAWGWVPPAAPVVPVGMPSAGLMEGIRAHVRDALRATLPPRAAGVVRALVLGDAAAVTQTDRLAVRGAGLAHVLAVSGLHVSLMAGALVWLTGRLLIRWSWLARRYSTQRAAWLLGVPIALTVAGFAGGAPSAWRAAVMAALGWALLALGRKPQLLALTATTALVLAVAQPEAATGPGFLLSVVATAALVSTPAVPGRNLLERLCRALRLSLRVSVATAPLVLWWFGTLPLVGVAANVTLAPVAAGVLIPLGLVHALTASLWPSLAAAVAPAVAAVIHVFVAACAWFAKVPGLTVPPLTLPEGGLLAVACLVLLSPYGHGRKWLALGVLACGIGVCEWELRVREQPNGRLRVTFLDVGQGDAALVDLPSGEAILIDAGGNPGGGPNPGERALLPLLQARRRERLAAVVITHPHPDHYGGLEPLVGKIEIEQLWDTGQAEAEQPEGELVMLGQRLQAMGTRILQPPELCGAPREVGGARLQVLWPCPGYDAALEPNDNSFVLRVEFGRHRFLFTGDIERDAESALLRRGLDLRAEVLKAPHHGSRTSSQPAFLAAVRPRLAVVSAGLGNRFGHPHASVMKRLRGASERVLRTDQDGGIAITSDGERLQVRTWREQHGQLSAP